MTDEETIDFLCRVCEKPGMYVVSVRFDTVWSFIEGFDVALDRRPLRGFQSWLCTLRDRWTNAPWFILVRERIIPGGTDPRWIPTGDEHARLIAETRDLLAEFKNVRTTLGIDEINRKYEEWAQRVRGGGRD